MAVASPPTGVCNGDLVRWTVEVLDTPASSRCAALWTDATAERLLSGAVHGADAPAGCFRTLLAALPDFHMEVVAIAETGDDVRGGAILTNPGSAADRATRAALSARTRLPARVRSRRRR